MLRVGASVGLFALVASAGCGDDGNGVAGPGSTGGGHSGGTGGGVVSGGAFSGGTGGSSNDAGPGGTLATGGTGAGAQAGAGGGNQAGSGGTTSGCAGAPPGSGGMGGPCEFPQGVPDPDFIASACSYQDTDPKVDADVNSVMASLTGCGVGSSCPITGFAGNTTDEICQSWFAAVTAALRAQGYCAGQHIVGSTDEIAVSNTGCGGKWYGYHICYYGGPSVVWNPGARRGWWMINPSYCSP